MITIAMSSKMYHKDKIWEDLKKSIISHLDYYLKDNDNQVLLGFNQNNKGQKIKQYKFEMVGLGDYK